MVLVWQWVNDGGSNSGEIINTDRTVRVPDATYLESSDVLTGRASPEEMFILIKFFHVKFCSDRKF